MYLLHAGKAQLPCSLHIFCLLYQQSWRILQQRSLVKQHGAVRIHFFVPFLVPFKEMHCLFIHRKLPYITNVA